MRPSRALKRKYYLLLRIIRILICFALTLSLFVPWVHESGFLGFGGEMVGLTTLGFTALVDPKVLCLPAYFIINLWFGQEYLALVICRLLTAGVSFASLLNSSARLPSYHVRWGYNLIIVTMGIAIIVELCHVLGFIREELGQRKRKKL